MTNATELKAGPREMSALEWAEGPGRVFFSNALVHGKPEQVRLTLARLASIKEGAPPAGPKAPQRAGQLNRKD